jgi:hypothetical protein
MHNLNLPLAAQLKALRYVSKTQFYCKGISTSTEVPLWGDD